MGDEVEILSSPVGVSAWQRLGGPYELGAGPVPSGEIVLQGHAGWFVQNDRVVVSGGRHQPSGAWGSWRPPCSSAGGPVLVAAPTASQVDAVCTEGVWTGQRTSVDLLRSTNGGTSFSPSRVVPVAAADLTAATGTSTLAIGAQVNGTGSADVTLEMTFDNGASWRSVYRNAGSGWLELGFTTPSQGVAIVLGAQGHLNTMLFTRDGGRHWARSRSVRARMTPVPRGPLPQDEYEAIYAKVPRLTVEVVIASTYGVLLTLRDTGPCRGLWHIPGGTVRFGEPLTGAVERVARQELHLDVRTGRLLGFLEYPSHLAQGLDWPVGMAFLAVPEAPLGRPWTCPVPHAGTTGSPKKCTTNRESSSELTASPNEACSRAPRLNPGRTD